MRRAIELARQVPDLPFGTVVVAADSGEIVAEGWNRTAQHPLWHGEIDAINRLVQQRWRGPFDRLVLYSTAEPCPMCQTAILWTGIGTVVYGTSIAFLAASGWRQVILPAEEVARRARPAFACQVEGGVLEAECNRLFEAARNAFG